MNNEKQLKYDQVMLNTCEVFSQLSKCSRGKVGAVIAKEGRIISTGYNGTPAGWKYKNTCTYCNGKGCRHCNNLGFVISNVNEYGKDCGETLVKQICKMCNYEKRIYSINDKITKCPKCGSIHFKEEYKTNHSIVMHAEANAILWAGRNGISCEGATLYCNYSPCPECSKLIMQSGIKRVVYREKYRDITGLYTMEDFGIVVQQIPK